MVFENFVCWDFGRVNDVAQTSAELAPRDIFLAVHSKYQIEAEVGVTATTTGASGTNKLWIMDPDQFLRDFLSPDSNHMQAVVLGNSGSGKSHFIRWVELNIPDIPDRHVISIPRSGISLRGIIERILEVLPDAQALVDRVTFIDEVIAVLVVGRQFAEAISRCRAEQFRAVDDTVVVVVESEESGVGADEVDLLGVAVGVEVEGKRALRQFGGSAVEVDDQRILQHCTEAHLG